MQAPETRSFVWMLAVLDLDFPEIEEADTLPPQKRRPRSGLTLADRDDGPQGFIPASIYHADRSCVSNSWLGRLDKTPAHLKAYLDAPHDEKRTPALIFGNALHMLVLEPLKFQKRFALWDGPPRNTKKGKDAWERWLLDNPIAEELNVDQWDRMHRMRDSLMATEAGQAMAKVRGVPEQTYIWTDPDTGVRCKCRVDYDTPTLMYDLKSTEDAGPWAFGRSCAKYGYHRQAAMYREGTGKEHMGFVAMEKDPPFAVAFYEPNDEFYQVGLDIYKKGLATIAACRKNDFWPAYSQHFELLQLPDWAV